MKCNICGANSIAVVKDTYEDIQVCEVHLEFYKDLGLPCQKYKK